MVILTAIGEFFMAIVQGITNVILAIIRLFGFILLFFTVILGLFVSENPNIGMITGEDLIGYHAVGEVWQESFYFDEEEQGQPDVMFEFQCLEATDKYIKLNIKLVEVSDELKNEEINIKLSYPYWEKITDENGDEYISNKDAELDSYAIYEDIAIDERGITLYMHYSFKTKVPAGYIKAEILEYGDSITKFEVKVFPHE